MIITELNKFKVEFMLPNMLQLEVVIVHLHHLLQIRQAIILPVAAVDIFS